MRGGFPSHPLYNRGPQAGNIRQCLEAILLVRIGGVEARDGTPCNAQDIPTMEKYPAPNVNCGNADNPSRIDPGYHPHAHIFTPFTYPFDYNLTHLFTHTVIP